MKRKWYKGQFGVESVSPLDEFRPAKYPTQVFDLRTWGLRSVPVFSRLKIRSPELPASWHVHDGYFEFVYCVSGSCDYEVAGERYSLKPGWMLVTTGHEAHRQLNSPRTFDIFAFQFRPVETARTRWLASAFSRLPHIVDCRPSVPVTFRKILALVKGDPTDVGQRFRLETAFWALCLDIIDSAAVRPEEKVSDTFQAIARRMQENPEKAYPIDELVSEAGVSRACFMATFKSVCGLSPHVYLLHCRVEKAKALLRAGEKEDRIAKSLSFSSTLHFVRTFRNFTGTPPAKWRVKRA